jgi:uncharacterized repeat protein (TIGR03837 family)
MARCEPRPVWFNLEGLTAEEWVEGCHTLPSSHPQLPLTKYFFFPGFNNKTGGLLREKSISADRLSFQSTKEESNKFLTQLGLSTAEIEAFKISMFCYPDAPLNTLFDVWSTGDQIVTCLIPEGVASNKVDAFFGQEAIAGMSKQNGNLLVRILPFIPQNEYDKLLWACDFNFVRGEDSFVRAQWANKPFVWHIYPQDENLHHKKLKAFLNTYRPASENLKALNLSWNAVNSDLAWPMNWQSLMLEIDQIQELTHDWEQEMQKNGDLSANLLVFAKSVT